VIAIEPIRSNHRAVVSAYRLAGLLRYAALQFIVLSVAAMVAYAGGTWWDPAAPRYRFAGNFLSDLGMTHAFSGRSNYVSCALFGIALFSVGIALVLFVWTWREVACARGRARWAGHTSAVVGTLCGLGFIGIALTPFDLALDAHNTLVLSAFSLLPLYVASFTFLMWRNGIDRARVAANVGYLVLVAGYMVLVLLGPRLHTQSGHTTQVLGQKIMAYGSMLHVLYLATTTRIALRASRSAAISSQVA
jgi:hypothetical membrane protein